MSKGQLMYLEEVTNYQLLHDPKKHIIMHELTCLLIKHKLRLWLDSFRVCLDGVGKEGEWKGVE